MKIGSASKRFPKGGKRRVSLYREFVSVHCAEVGTGKNKKKKKDRFLGRLLGRFLVACLDENMFSLFFSPFLFSFLRVFNLYTGPEN